VPEADPPRAEKLGNDILRVFQRSHQQLSIAYFEKHEKSNTMRLKKQLVKGMLTQIPRDVF